MNRGYYHYKPLFITLKGEKEMKKKIIDKMAAYGIMIIFMIIGAAIGIGITYLAFIAMKGFFLDPNAVSRGANAFALIFATGAIGAPVIITSVYMTVYYGLRGTLKLGRRYLAKHKKEEVA